ncbi:uncharacterized protein LOC134285543 isoform X1 [Aedes albopictus]|uniref:Uncharacterized protein n=2 Tax=Aedes albopictus TaxID=7160 RepID=A0ABM1Z1Z2_AEDAL
MCTYSFLKSFRLSVSFCRSCQDGAFDSFREKMQDLRVEAYTTSGKIHAHVTCPICDDSKQSKISLNMDTTGSWHIFAFKRHCKTFHIQTPHSSKQKRRSVTPVATDDANENDCPIKRPSLESTGIGTACDFELTTSSMDPPHLDTAGTEIDPLHLDEAETEIGPAEYLDDTVSSSTGDLQAEKIHEYNVSDTKGKYFDETVYDSQDDYHGDAIEAHENDSWDRNTKEHGYAKEHESKDVKESSKDHEIVEEQVEQKHEGHSTATRYPENYTGSQFIGHVTRKSSSPLPDLHVQMDSRSKLCKPNGIRYTEPELDAAAYELMAGGNSNYQFIKANMQLPSSKTLKRHIAKHTTETQEGILMVTPLLKYLNAHNYPLVVSLSEDGTTLSPNPEYDSRNDSIRGLVAPLDHSGMPEQDTFNASTVEKMINDLERYSVGEYLYIVMATPMAVGALPFCILYMCSDNRFTHDQVISRWNYIESELLKAGITVIANASDGDPRLLMAMRQRSTLHALHVGSESQYGPHFAMNNDFKLDFKAISIQGSIHLVNKFRHSLLDPKKQMRLGNDILFTLL